MTNHPLSSPIPTIRHSVLPQRSSTITASHSPFEQLGHSQAALVPMAVLSYTKSFLQQVLIALYPSVTHQELPLWYHYIQHIDGSFTPTQALLLFYRNTYAGEFSVEFSVKLSVATLTNSKLREYGRRCQDKGVHAASPECLKCVPFRSYERASTF